MNARLLRLIRESAGDYLPLEVLQTCSQNPQADLDEIEAFGFSVERHPLRGVAYRGPADRLCPDQIEEALGASLIGRRVAVWNRVTSTNDLAARAAGSRRNEGLVVLAEEQTAGRGRRGRSWNAPPHSSVLLSVLIFPEGPLADPAWLTALGAVSVAELVRDWTGAEAKIKWPNDVRVHGRKIAGILVERGAGAVIGIGLNVNMEPDGFPLELADSSTSIQILKGHRVDRSDLAAFLIRRLDNDYRVARERGPEPLRAAWRDLSEHAGRVARVETSAGVLSGEVREIDLLDGLTLRSSDGTTRVLSSTEVTSITTLE